jgi:large subunit ribosomal protein L30
MAKAKIKKSLKIKLVRSTSGGRPAIRATVTALGLRKLQHSVTQPNTPAIRGMVKKAIHLLEVEEVDD